MTPSDGDWDSAMFDQNRKLPGEITGSSEFRAWQSTLPTIVLDGETLYLARGDVPMDENEIAYHWARSTGLLETQSTTKRFQGRGAGTGPKDRDEV